MLCNFDRRHVIFLLIQYPGCSNIRETVLENNSFFQHMLSLREEEYDLFVHQRTNQQHQYR